MREDRLCIGAYLPVSWVRVPSPVQGAGVLGVAAVDAVAAVVVGLCEQLAAVLRRGAAGLQVPVFVAFARAHRKRPGRCGTCRASLDESRFCPSCSLGLRSSYQCADSNHPYIYICGKYAHVYITLITTPDLSTRDRDFGGATPQKLTLTPYSPITKIEYILQLSTPLTTLYTIVMLAGLLAKELPALAHSQSIPPRPRAGPGHPTRCGHGLLECV